MKNQNQFVFVGNCSNLNRGCEAILLGTIKSLDAAFGDSRYVNFYNYLRLGKDRQREKKEDRVKQIPMIIPPRGTVRWFFKHSFLRTCPPLYWKYKFHILGKYLGECKAALAIGGDIYSLDYRYPEYYLQANRFVHRSGRPLILWGMSVGPFDGHPKKKNIFDNFNECVDAVFVREKRSSDYLRANGCKFPVHIMADPAFIMDAAPCTEDRLGFSVPHNAIGINLSPLIGRLLPGQDDASFKGKCVDLVRKVYGYFGLPVLLIPHSTPPWDDDYPVLESIYAELREECPGLHLLPRDLDGPETKWVISRLACLVAARSHATIASFSSLRPTVSIAYSVKAWGINEMVFGHTDYVIDCKELDPKKVIGKIKKVMQNQSKIKKHLKAKIPVIQKSVYVAGEKLKQIVS